MKILTVERHLYNISFAYIIESNVYIYAIVMHMYNMVHNHPKKVYL